MKPPLPPSTDQTLHAENAGLRARLADAEEMLRAIRAGEVDALVVEGDAGPRLFTLQGRDAEQNHFRGEMLAQVSDALITSDREGHLTFLNPAAEQLYRVRSSDMLGRKLSELYDCPSTSLEEEAAAWAALEECGHWRGEKLHRTRDGRELHVELRRTILRDPETGERTGSIAAIRDISERNQLEQEKAEALRLLDTLLTCAPVGLVFLDRELRFMRVNERLAEMNGLSIAAHLGRTVAEILPTLEVALRAVTARIVETGQPVLDHEFTGETVSQPGVARSWNESWYPVRGERGEILGFGGVVQESTQSKQASEALRLSNERFDLAVKCSNVVLWQQDLELRFSWLHNPTQGINGSNAVGKRDEDLLERAEDAAVIVGLKREVIETGLSLRKEFFPQLQGVDHCFEVLMEPLHDATGVITGITGAAIDITERKRNETALKISEVRYRRLFESAKDGILILDANTAKVTHANPFIAEMLGYLQDEFVGKELWQIGMFKDVETSKAAMQILQDKGYIRYEDLPLETKAGRRINVEFISNVYGQDENAIIQCNIRDISDRKRLEESLKQHAADLADADRRKDEFLATLAHELRNPLAAVRSAVQILLKDGPTAEPGLLSLQNVIDRQSGHMIRLIDDLMDVGRVSRGKVALKRQTVDIRNVVREAAGSACAAYIDRNHEVKLTLPEWPLKVDGDPLRLAQIVANLLSNSCRYTDAGGTIEVSLSREGEREDQAVLRVKDNGIGMLAAMLPCVFETFSQADTSLDRAATRTGGLGIGLALVKSLVEQHGGSVEACSEGLGKGSEFVVRLPALPADEPEVTAHSHNGGPKATDELRAGAQEPLMSQAATLIIQSPQALRVLVVDDNVDSANCLALLLKSDGYTTYTAYDGQEAVEQAVLHEPDIVLLDIGLPLLNGYEACRLIREKMHRQAPIMIALTGWGQDGDRQKSQEAGFHGHLVKPVDLDVLLSLLPELMAKRPLSTECSSHSLN